MPSPALHPGQPGLHPRIRQAKVAGYHHHLLDVAEREFALHGYEAARMKAVASGAAVSLATLYAHFPTKMDLYRGVHRRRLEELGALLAAPVDAGGPLESMLAAMAIYVPFHLRHPAWLRMHLREGNAWSGDERLRSVEQTEAWQSGIEAMASTFRAGIRAGTFIDDDPILMARTTNALHQVALSRWVDQGMTEAAGPVVTRLQGRFVRAFCVPERVPGLLAAHGLRGAS